MPRGGSGSASRHSHGGVGGGGSMVAVDAILAKEPSYRKGVKDNHTIACVLAESLALEGQLEQAMMNDGNADEVKQFLEKQRERLKQVALKNVENNRGIDAFCGAVREVGQEMANKENEEDNDGGEDYAKVLSAKMKEFAKSQRGAQLSPEDETYCRDIRSRLGEKEPKKKKRRGEDDDDDLEVLRQPEGTQSLKCPITGVLFDDPVKNKLCGHVYSRAGILQVISLHKQCPVPGCPNQRPVALDQLEEDEEMTIKVRRQKRRDELERQQRLTQAMENDSDEEVL